MPDVRHVIQLERLTTGQHGRVVAIEGSEKAAVRLAEIGLRPGADLRMLRAGEPCIIAIDNQRLSFRGDGAAVVMVETS
jgi:Fe2+ transport system protein FeoA